MTTLVSIDSEKITSGAGYLYVAPLGTPEPSAITDGLDPAFRPIGYTKTGSQFKVTTTTVPVETIWDLEATRQHVTKREISVVFEMSQSSVGNLALALNMGADFDESADLFDPPDPGEDVRVMIALLTDAGGLWLFRQCVNNGALASSFTKAPDYTTIPVEFQLERPYNAKTFRMFPPEPGFSPLSSAGEFGSVFGAVF